MVADNWLHHWSLCYIDQIVHVSVVTVHLVGGILDEVQYNILDEGYAWPLEHTEYCMVHPPITTASRIHIEGLVTSTWCFRLRMDFDVEILISPLFSSKMEVGTAASSYFNMTSSHLRAFLHGNNLPLDRLVESCGTSRLEFLQPGFSNLNSIFNIYIFVADLPGDTVDKILALGDIKGIHTRLQLVSDSTPVITVGLYYCGGLLRIRWLFQVSNVLCQSRTIMEVQCQRACSFSTIPNIPPGPWPYLINVVSMYSSKEIGHHLIESPQVYSPFPHTLCPDKAIISSTEPWNIHQK